MADVEGGPGWTGASVADSAPTPGPGRGDGSGDGSGDGPGDGPVSSRPRGHKRAKQQVYRRRRLFVAVAAAVVLALFVSAVAWYQSQMGGNGGATVVITVTPGSSMEKITSTLVRRHVVDNSLAFRVYLTLHGTPVVQPGSYLLHRDESFATLRATLAGGPDVSSVTVLPGFTINEVATQVGEIAGHDPAHFLSLANSGTMRSPYEPVGSTNLDGLVGTGTYLVLPGESDETLLGDMMDRFNTLADSVGLTSGATALGVTPYQAITVASIVQKEGVYQKNLGKVARVIYNRLARGTPLQMDSTVLYSEHRDGGRVTSADLALNTPYNTYLHTGLTPTPICFPNQASLQAALAPPPGPWLYFVVVSKDGTEAFSSTFAGQQANERLAQTRGVG
ncbi:MAG TPA: endolytic transglycosylase MltG [Acidimicrobiales bacterium]|nr:endolytic transglycosylase MltG [Acidimicrobiales bacterium]